MVSQSLRRRLPVINWLDEATLVAVFVAETALLWLIVASLVAVGEDSAATISPWLILALIVASSTLPRLLDSLSIWEPWYQIVLAIAIALSALVTINQFSYPDQSLLKLDWIGNAFDALIFRPDSAVQPVWAGIVIVAIVWWRSRTRETPSVDSSYRFLRVGFLIAMVGISIFALSAHRSDQQGSAAAVLLFFTSSVAAIGLCRAASADRLGYERISPKGLAIALSPALATAAGAVLLAGIFTSDTVDTIFWALGPLLWVIGIVLQGIVLVIAVIVLIILSPFIYLLQGRTPNFQGIRLNTQTIFATSDTEETSSQFDLLPDPIRYLLAAIVLFLVFGGLTKLILRRKANRQTSGEDAERETMRPVFDWRSMLASLLNSLGFGPKTAQEDPLASLRDDPRWAYTVSIRENYIRFLAWSDRRGIERTASMTPTEHSGKFPDLPLAISTADLDELIAGYNSARYGERPSTRHEAERVQIAWQHVQQSTKAES